MHALLQCCFVGYCCKYEWEKYFVYVVHTLTVSGIITVTTLVLSTYNIYFL